MRALKYHFTSLAACLILLPMICGCAVGRYMCDVALLPEEHGNDLAGDRAKTERRYPGVIKWYDDLRTEGSIRDTSITGEGGFRLHGSLVSVPNAKGTAIVIHGYTDNHICYLNLVRMYRDSLGFNVLVPDLHYHGYSEGRAIQMGWKDRLDIIRWIDVAHDKWDNDFMVIHGVSMGGATTMMVSGESLPPYVRAFVDDCGYSSVWKQFAHILKSEYHLPAFPVLNSASIVCRNRYGWGYKEASCTKQLAKCDKPFLFIHGGEDSYVPTAHLYENYEAKVNGYKELWIAPGSAHAAAYRDHPAEYTAHVRAFLDTVRRMEAE